MDPAMPPQDLSKLESRIFHIDRNGSLLNIVNPERSSRMNFALGMGLVIGNLIGFLMDFWAGLYIVLLGIMGLYISIQAARSTDIRMTQIDPDNNVINFEYFPPKFSKTLKHETIPFSKISSITVNFAYPSKMPGAMNVFLTGIDTNIEIYSLTFGHNAIALLESHFKNIRQDAREIAETMNLRWCVIYLPDETPESGHHTSDV